MEKVTLVGNCIEFYFGKYKVEQVLLDSPFKNNYRQKIKEDALGNTLMYYIPDESVRTMIYEYFKNRFIVSKEPIDFNEIRDDFVSDIKEGTRIFKEPFEGNSMEFYYTILKTQKNKFKDYLILSKEGDLLIYKDSISLDLNLIKGDVELLLPDFHSKEVHKVYTSDLEGLDFGGRYEEGDILLIEDSIVDEIILRDYTDFLLEEEVFVKFTTLKGKSRRYTGKITESSNGNLLIYTEHKGVKSCKVENLISMEKGIFKYVNQN